jgi:O-antigen ligase
MPVAAMLYCRSSRKWLLHFAALLVLAAVVYVMRDQVQELLLARGISVRDVIWAEVFARGVQEHAIWGLGLEKEGRIVLSDGAVYNHAHNAWLDMFYRTGVVGLVLSVVYVGYLLRQALGRREFYPLVLWFIFGCIYSMVDSRGFFWQIDPKWFCIWLPAGLLGALISAQRNNLFAAQSAAGEQDNS